MQIIAVIVIVLAGLLCTRAEASSVTWLDGKRGQAFAHQYETADGVGFSVTATAAFRVAPLSVFIAPLVEAADGLGVYSYNRDSDYLDGQMAIETLWMEFDERYRIDSLIFSRVNTGDHATLLDAAGRTLARLDVTHSPAVGANHHLDVTGLDLGVTRLGISALEEDDNFKLVGFSGHLVPTPSAALAGCVGLIALVTRRRRPAEA